MTAIFSLLDTPAFGGAEQYMFSNLSSLNKAGYKIILATNNKQVKQEFLKRLSSDQKKTFRIINAPYLLDAIGNWKGLVKFFISLPRAIVWCFFILKELKQQHGQVICLWSGFSDRLVFSPIAKFFKCKLIWIEIGPLEPTFKKNFGFPKILYRLMRKYPNHLVTTSLFTKKSIIKNTNFRSKKIALIYPGTKNLSESELKKYKTKALVWKKHKNLNNFILIGLVARLAHENEIDITIKAFAEYLKICENKNVKLVIIGDGPAKIELENLAKDLSIINSVIFCGFVSEEEKFIILSSCNFFIFPRAWELDGFGITTIEAMSLGLPVITSNFGPQMEIVRNNYEGYRYKPHDINDLARTMQEMSKISPIKRELISKNVLKRVKTFSENLSHDKMIKLIENI